MIPRSANDDVNPPMAIGGGIAAGLATLAVIGGLIWLAGRSGESTEIATPATRIGTTVPNGELQAGDCFDFTTGSSATRQFRIADCDTSHLAQVSAKVDHPETNGDYPGTNSLKAWIGDRCDDLTADYIDAAILDTTLDADVLLPDGSDWLAGNGSATCYVKRLPSAPFTASAAGAGNDFPRGAEVVVSRLIDGDCFTPTDGTSSYDLNSNSNVMLVSCDTEHNGVFFGRALLDNPIGDAFPGEAEVGDATSARCSSLFEDHFGKQSTGFNYRYWRPNQQSWDLDDRQILCAVLDTNPLVKRFNPADYERFFDLAMGDCFNLGPEENDDSLRLDDQVLIVECGELHIGQMIGSGKLGLDLAEPFPEGDRILELAGGECERLFTEFVGASPYESDLGNFPFWYPNQPGWEEGDRRYACAFLEETPLDESREDAEA